LPNGIKSWPDPVSDGWWHLVASGGVYSAAVRFGLSVLNVLLSPGSLNPVAAPSVSPNDF
jgi:hypothetical protein